MRKHNDVQSITQEIREYMHRLEELQNPDVEYLPATEEILTEDEDDFILGPDLFEEISEDLQKLVSKLHMITENHENEDYVRGYEDGMFKAADMIETILKKYNVGI